MVEETRLLDSIPSGSGIVIRNDSAYIIGDDATGLYQISLADLHFRKIPLTGFSYTQYREEKNSKRDLESLTFLPIGSDHLAAFGSGSKGSVRDSMLLVDLADPAVTKMISLRAFYSTLRRQTKTDSVQWNIEGATVAGNRIFLSNRGNNLLIQTALKDFSDQLFQPVSQFPAVQISKVKLPSIGNREARISGICTINENLLLLTASVEDTDDWIKDGPVLGSYLAVYSIKSDSITASYLLKDASGKPLIEKLESVDIRERKSNGELKLIAVGDNDNGKTKLFRLSLRIDSDRRE